MSEVLLLDIDGVICEPQKVISTEMMEAILNTKRRVFYCTGNSYTKAVDLAGNRAIFSCNANELRQAGSLIWKAEEKSLPIQIESYLQAVLDEHKSYGNSIEWRSPSFINFSPIGRFAPWDVRLAHKPDWQDDLKNYIEKNWQDVCVTKGAVSVDIFVKGADKSRAGKWLNDNGMTFTFIGDKTTPDGNDYPLVQYCNEHPENKYFTSTGPAKTMRILERL